MMFRLFKSKLVRVSSGYMLATAINTAVPFLMIPILTRYLSKMDYGILAMFQVVIAILLPVIGLSTHGAVSVKYFKMGQEQFAQFTTACVIIIFTIFLAVFFLVQLSGSIISKWTAIPMQWLWSCCVFALCQGLINLRLAIWQARMKFISYGIFLFFKSITNMGLSIWYVVYLHYDWSGRVLGQVWAGLLFASVALIIIKWTGLISFGKQFRQHVFDAIAFGLPLVPNYVLVVIGAMIGRILINNLINTEEAGLYSLGYQIASILLVLASAFNLAYSPWLFEKLKENDHTMKLTIVRFTYVYFAIALAFALILGVLAPMFFPFFVGAAFLPASQFVVWFSIAFAFNGMHMMVVNYIFFAEKTVFVTLITVPMVLLNIGLSYMFITKIGSIGAAQVQALISFISFVCMWFLSNKSWPMPWFSKELLPRQLRHI